MVSVLPFDPRSLFDFYHLMSCFVTLSDARHRPPVVIFCFFRCVEGQLKKLLLAARTLTSITNKKKKILHILPLLPWLHIASVSSTSQNHLTCCQVLQIQTLLLADINDSLKMSSKPRPLCHTPDKINLTHTNTHLLLHLFTTHASALLTYALSYLYQTLSPYL